MTVQPDLKPPSSGTALTLATPAETALTLPSESTVATDGLSDSHRYEDKIKERKKAEIEAKKAAIRAEDIANGVFVPVSTLLQREPQKGTQIA